MSDIPKTSPWGKVDHATILAPGIVSVSTSSHGGIHLDRAHQAIIRKRFPAYADSPRGRFSEPWYEEDCDWSVPFMMFDGEILAYLQSQGPSWELDHYAENHDLAYRTWRNWLPDSFEEYFGVTLKPGESYIRDEHRKERQQTITHLSGSFDGVCCVSDADPGL